MEWYVSKWSGISISVAADIAKHGLEAVYNAIMQAARSSENPRNSDALSYLAAEIDTDEVRAAAKKMTPILASFNGKVSMLEDAYKKFAESAIKLDYQALDFSDYLEPKALPLSLPARTPLKLKQPAVRIAEKIAEIRSMVPIDDARDHFEKFITSSLPDLLQKQIELYEYFVSYESRFNLEEQNKKHSTHTSLTPIPGKLHKIVEMGELYRSTKSQLITIRKNMEAFQTTVEVKNEAAEQYNVAQGEIQKLIYDEIGNFIDNYYEISQSMLGEKQ